MSQNSTRSKTDGSSSKSDTSSSKSGRLLKFALVAVVILLLLVAFLPRIAAAWMRENIQSRLSDETQLDISLGSLSAGWFSGVNVGDLKVSVPSGQEVVHIRRIATQKGLLGLITRDKEVGEVYIDAPRATMALSDGSMQELQAAIAQIDPTKGLIKAIADPERDALVNFRISDAGVSLLTAASAEWQTITDGLDANVTLDREGQNVQIDADLSSPLTLSPILGDYGLQFITPVLAKALEMDGEASLSIDRCHIDPANFQKMELNGNLMIHSVNAQVDGPVIGKITDAIGRLSAEPGQDPQSPVLDLQVTSESNVEFSVVDGIVHHEGFAFGLPKVLPSLVLTTSGDVTFDKTLDLSVKASIPFDRMGEGELLQKLGAPSFSVPVTGTFEEPKVDVGEGKVLGRFVQELVLNATDKEIDPGPLLKQLAESGLLSKLGKKNDAESDGEESVEPDVGGAILKRLGGLLKRRNGGSESELPASEAMREPLPSGFDETYVPPKIVLERSDEEMESPQDEETDEARRGGILKRLRERRQRNKQQQ